MRPLIHAGDIWAKIYTYSKWTWQFTKVTIAASLESELLRYDLPHAVVYLFQLGNRNVPIV